MDKCDAVAPSLAASSSRVMLAAVRKWRSRWPKMTGSIRDREAIASGSVVSLASEFVIEVMHCSIVNIAHSSQCLPKKCSHLHPADGHRGHLAHHCREKDYCRFSSARSKYCAFCDETRKNAGFSIVKFRSSSC